MKRRLLLLLLAAGLPLGGAGCSGGGEGLSLDGLPGEAARAWCQKAYLCCNAAEIAQMEASLDFQGEGGCRDYLSGWLELYVTTPMKNAVSVDRGSYDPDKAQACVAAYDALGCTGSNDVEDFFAHCDVPYQGLQAAGADCYNTYECQSGTWCSTNTKRCTVPAGLNDQCSLAGEPYCGTELYCDSQTLTCVQTKPKDSDCQATVECAAGLICHETQLTCQEPDPVCTGQ